MTLVAGSRVIRAGMVVQLATVKQEQNAAILKVIEKDVSSSACRSSSRVGIELWCYLVILFLPLELSVTPCLCLFFRGPGRAGAVLGISRAGRVRPEPGPRGPVQVGCHYRKGRRGHRQAWLGDEFGHGRTRCIAWSADA
jgi:hypothetical protein